MTQLPDPLAFLSDEVAALRERHLYRPLRVMSSAQGPIVSVDDRRLISLSSNDYLGLTHHRRVCDAAAAAVREFGAGSGAVRTIAGTMTMHEALEAELAAFKETPAVLTFQSGFTANTGVIPTITGETDLIVGDALNHASIIDGMRLSKAPRQIYPHADVAAMREILRQARETGRPGGGPYRLILVVTDGVFSMDGDIAPLPALVEAAEEFGAAVMVDDAHASGVLGRNGRGSVDHFGLHGRVAVQVGTLSKAVGSLGGYVAGSVALREILTQRARPFLFSTSHPRTVARAAGRPPDLALDGFAGVQQPLRIQRRLHFQAGVEELGLVEHEAHRLGLIGRRGAQHGHTVTGERGHGRQQMGPRLADVGAQAEKAPPRRAHRPRALRCAALTGRRPRATPRPTPRSPGGPAAARAWPP